MWPTVGIVSVVHENDLCLDPTGDKTSLLRRLNLLKSDPSPREPDKA